MEESKRLVYFNGKFIPESKAKISIYDSALMFGDMVFEMTRSFNKKQFKLKEHIERLLIGVKIFRIPLDYSANQIEDACYETLEVNKEFFIKAKKFIDNNSFTLDKYLKLQEEWDNKLMEHPFAEVNTPIIRNYDPSIKIKPIFIERSKRQRFETVAEKRLSNIEKSISTFNNFFSKTNVANYDFTKDDMISIDERITKSVNQFRLNYEQFFASNPDKKVKKNSKIEKYKKNIDGTDPSVIQNIREKMKGGD